MLLTTDMAQNRSNAMNLKPEQTFYHNLRYSPLDVNLKILQTTIVLTPFVGNITGLPFVFRLVASLTQESSYQFIAISNFSILNSTSSNCVGIQPIPSALALTYPN